VERGTETVDMLGREGVWDENRRSGRVKSGYEGVWETERGLMLWRVAELIVELRFSHMHY
jgi:hypothetical protein